VQESEDPPLAAEHALVKEANAAVADTHGGGGEVIDVFAVKQIALQFFFGNQVGTLGIELRDQVDFADIGLDGRGTFAVQLQSGGHLLTQWGHGNLLTGRFENVTEYPTPQRSLYSQTGPFCILPRQRLT
jgi:hypothetical protein